ncbi:MAG: hypothetical protein J2P45_19670, partial [Candidatus Dormibacteraeota bacterium]|nr:hypothetical protein [Candidatus Dormibacteraeota bacterium]
MRSNAIRLALAAAVVLLIGIPGSARAAAGLAQRYNQDLVSAGSDIDLHPGDTVRRDVVCLGCSVVLDGASVGGDVVAAGGSITITDGHVGRDVAAYGGSIALRGKATVGGDATATGGGLSVKNEARVGGEASAPALASAAMPGFLTFWTLGSLAPALGFVLLSLVLLWVFPRQVLAAGRLAEHRPAASFGLGCLGVVV